MKIRYVSNQGKAYTFDDMLANFQRLASCCQDGVVPNFCDTKVRKACRKKVNKMVKSGAIKREFIAADGRIFDHPGKALLHELHFFVQETMTPLGKPFVCEKWLQHDPRVVDEARKSIFSCLKEYCPNHPITRLENNEVKDPLTFLENMVKTQRVTTYLGAALYRVMFCIDREGREHEHAPNVCDQPQTLHENFRRLAAMPIAKNFWLKGSSIKGRMPLAKGG